MKKKTKTDLKGIRKQNQKEFNSGVDAETQEAVPACRTL